MLPGSARVLSKRHVVEPFDLTEDGQAAFVSSPSARTHPVPASRDSPKARFLLIAVPDELLRSAVRFKGGR